MNIKVTGKEVKVTDAIKDYAEKKLDRIEKYFEGEEIDAIVTDGFTGNIFLKTSSRTTSKYKI